MNQRTIEALNRLLVIHRRSFPMYITEARPWVGPGEERAVEVLQHIEADQSAMTGRIAATIQAAGGTPDLGQFPIEFTDAHDLALDYLLRASVTHQQADIRSIEACIDQLSLSPASRAVAEEALGQAKGHLQSLTELVSQPA